MTPWLPKEHGLWTWVGVPLLVAAGLAPAVSTAVGVAGGVLGFFAFNAARRGAWAHAAGAATGALLAACGLVATATRPDVAIGTCLAGGGAAALAGWLHRGALPRHAGFEVAGILTLAGLGAGLAVAAGASPLRAGLAQLALATWSVAGLWWVRRLLVGVLPQRAPWREGPRVAAALAGACLAGGVLLHEPLVGAVPLLYPLRMLAHRAPTRAVEARRVGLTELVWVLGAATLAVLA